MSLYRMLAIFESWEFGFLFLGNGDDLEISDKLDAVLCECESPFLTAFFVQEYFIHVDCYVLVTVLLDEGVDGDLLVDFVELKAEVFIVCYWLLG
jgi:hypothetical protein